MESKKQSPIPTLVLIFLLVLSLPLLYQLVSRVLLPMEWNEPQVQESSSTTPES